MTEKSLDFASNNKTITRNVPFSWLINWPKYSIPTSCGMIRIRNSTLKHCAMHSIWLTFYILFLVHLFCCLVITPISPFWLPPLLMLLCKQRFQGNSSLLAKNVTRASDYQNGTSPGGSRREAYKIITIIKLTIVF